MRATRSTTTISRVGAIAIAALIALAASGCAAARQSARGTRIVVVERDFGITASPTSVAAGSVTLHIENQGPSTHELVVDRTFLSSEALPLRRNGLAVNEDSTDLVNISSEEEIRLHASRDVTMSLTPGHYVLYCNLEGHYLGGMNVTLDVKE